MLIVGPYKSIGLYRIDHRSPLSREARRERSDLDRSAVRSVGYRILSNEGF